MKTILLIEDNLQMRENIAEILELARYKVLTAADGKAGVKLAQTEKPDLIVCDIMMPELDGYGVIRMLSTDSSTAGIPFIFLSAKAEKGDQRMGMNLGADDYLTKPFLNSELLHAVETRLRKHEILKSEFSRTADGLTQFLSEVKGTHSLEKLSENKERRSYHKKEHLYEESQFPKGIFFITKGKVKTSRANEEGKEYVTGLFKEGDFIGFTSLLEEKKYTDAAIALEESEAVIIPKEDFFTLLYSSSEVAGKFIRMLADNVSEMENRLLKLAYNSVRKRVAEALLLLQNRYAAQGQNLSMAVSREDLAAIVGTASETVTRTLSDFKEEGIITVKGSNISILDHSKLEKMKN